MFWRKEFAPDSGGPGTFRGGLGQVIEVGNTEDAPFTVSAATWDRIVNPPRGRGGGASGKPGKAYLVSGGDFSDKSVHTVPQGERFIVELPGGGGLGHPYQRESTLIQRDIEAGYLTPEGAKKDYGYDP